VGILWFRRAAEEGFAMRDAHDGPARGAVVLLLAVLGIAIAAAGAFLLFSAKTPPVAPGVRRGTSATATRSPVPPSPQAHRLAHDVPVSISIPSAGIAATVVPVGLTSAGVMAVTLDPHKADWFAPGTYPGDQGSAVIAGHSGYAHSSASFDPLPKVRIGDLVHVRGSRGDTLTFKVFGKRKYPADAQAPEVFDRSDGVYLNLVSCTGTWNAQLGTHNLRLVVFARLVG
jgi:sortase A